MATKGLALPGLLSGATSSIVDPLSGQFDFFILQKFQNEAMSLDDAEEKKSTQANWIGIVDGCHYHNDNGMIPLSWSSERKIEGAFFPTYRN